MKRILALLCAALLLPQTVFAASRAEMDAALYDTARYVYTSVPSPTVGSVGGEWAVIGLSESGYDVPQQYYDGYYNALCAYLNENNGVMHRSKYTEYSRAVIALTQTDKNPADVSGFDLLAPLADYDKTTAQGLNGAIWALIALDSGGYAIHAAPEVKTQATRQMYIDTILSRRLFCGGWALSPAADTADTDITAMALRALSRYRIIPRVERAVQRGMRYLGSLNEYGTCEAAAQTLMAFDALDIPFESALYQKAADELLSYYIPGKGFAHIGTVPDEMATEQALCALAACRAL